jgi:hypothetical protein
MNGAVTREKPHGAGGTAGLCNEVPGTNARPSELNAATPRDKASAEDRARSQGDPPPYPEEAETSLGIFYEQSTVTQMLSHADVARRLGFVPEIRLCGDGIELYVKDLPSMIRTLRASLVAKKP